MRVSHPAIQGGTRTLDRVEEASVRLFRVEENGQKDTGEFSEWWSATKSSSALTGQSITEVRDYSWSWAQLFAAYCEEE